MEKSIPWAEELLTLEAEIRQTLTDHVQRELDREYQPKQRNKALKLAKAAWEDLAIAGEQLRALIREGSQVFRVDMTFPLFDLDSDFTLIRCTCLKEALSLEALRCHHMFFLQRELLASLKALAAKEAQPEGYQAESSDLLAWLPEATAFADESLLWERRWHLQLNGQTWEPHLWRERRLRYEPAANWEFEEAFSWSAFRQSLRDSRLSSERDLSHHLARAQGDERGELFCLLEQVEWPLSEQGSARPITVRLEPGLLALVEQGERDTLSYSLGGQDLRQLLCVPGQGYLALVKADAAIQLFVARLEPHALAFISQLATKSDWSFPREQRAQLLKGLDRLDTRLFSVREQSKVREPMPVKEQRALLRLTPFSRGGMRIELRIRIAPHLSVLAGEGNELYRDLEKASDWVWQRDLSAERQLARRWVQRLDLELFPEPEPHVYIAYNDQRALDLLQGLEQLGEERKDLLVEWPEALQQKPYELAAKIDGEKMTIQLGEKRDWFQLEGWLALEDGTKMALKDVLALIRRQQRYIQLSDGRWAMLSEHFQQRIESLLAMVDVEEDSVQLSLSALGDRTQLEALSTFPFAEVSRKFWGKVHKAKRAYQQDIELPSGLQAELRSYQLDGYRWLCQLYEAELGACLADDMGLGKTLQTLSLLLAKAQQGPSLVVAPSSLSYNWAAEAARFCPDLEVVLLRELSDRGQGQVFKAGQLVVASYGLLLRYAESLGQVDWNILVFDEAQYLKNAQTKTARAAQELQARWKLALSGTPIENRLSELWALFRVISPGLFGAWERFRGAYVFPIERDRNLEAQRRLKDRLAPFVLRRLKRDYLSELPEKTELDLWIDLSAEEREAYDAFRGEALEKITALETAEAAELGQQKIQVLAALTRLRQAACHRGLVESEWVGASTKIELLRDKLDELKQAGHAVLVFSQFTRFLGKIRDVLTADGINCLYLDGQTPPLQRQEMVQQFQAGQGDVFLISLKAGGTGLNLTRASYVFHMDPWWNPAVEQQATDRAYRMGQKQAVTVYRLRAKETIEELIHVLHGEKRELMEGVLEGREPSVQWSWELVWDLLQAGSRPSVQEKAARNPAARSHRLEWEEPSIVP